MASQVLEPLLVLPNLRKGLMVALLLSFSFLFGEFVFANILVGTRLPPSLGHRTSQMPRPLRRLANPYLCGLPTIATQEHSQCKGRSSGGETTKRRELPTSMIARHLGGPDRNPPATYHIAHPNHKVCLPHSR